MLVFGSTVEPLNSELQNSGKTLVRGQNLNDQVISVSNKITRKIAENLVIVNNFWMTGAVRY